MKRKIGFPFLWRRYRKRKGFFAGILICIILVYILSLFIWDISVIGGSKYTPEAMRKFLKDNHVYAGIQKKDVNCHEIEEIIRLAYNDIGWVSAEVKGTRLIIKITETNMPAPAQKAMAPSHIVATKDADTTELRRYLQSRLPDYMVPSVFVALDKFSLTPNGKIDRKALPEPANAEPGEDFVAPQTPTEELLAAIYSELLHVEKVSAHADFFELGGHSLLVTQAISRIRALFEVELPYDGLYNLHIPHV
jgi:acyl-CoA synthetase (AMP-forming)/AMP-acid ligase II